MLTNYHTPTEPNSISVLSDGGSGRAFLTVIDDSEYLPFASAIAEKLALKARSILLLSSSVTTHSWSQLSQRLIDVMAELGVRQCSLVAMGAGATLVQNVALNQPKLVRSLAIVDASSRPHPTLFERAIDWLEERLPFGLPLRLGSHGFNVKAYLHRLRCPVLLIATKRSSKFVREEVVSMALRAPTAWHVELTGSDGAEINELSNTLLAFQDLPAKCPQKNNRSQTHG